MARVSFRLQNPAGGSSLHGHSSAGDDNDGLKADGLQLAPLTELVGTSFVADSTCYGEVDLSWTLPLTTAGESTPEPTQYAVVYSPHGPPQTIPSGYIVSEGSASFSARHRGLPEGQFAYYSLFVRYQSNSGDDYYEKVAELGEMVVQNYGSTVDMWNRIPAYYREADTAQGTMPTTEEVRCLGFDNYGDPVGPLLKFLAIFGFEMDRSITIMKHIARAKDPQYADPESLQALSEEMNTLIDVSDLGAARLRTLLNHIGVFRRIKGTEDGTEFFIKSLSGNNAEVTEATNTIVVDSGRVNHILDPRNNKSVIDIEATTAATFGEAESPATAGSSFVSTSTYPASSYLSQGSMAAAAPGFVPVGIDTVGDPTLTGVSEAAGPQTYTTTSDPDVVIPAGHAVAVNDDSSVNTNDVVWAHTSGTGLTVTNGAGAIVAGSVFIPTVTSPDTGSVFRVGSVGDPVPMLMEDGTEMLMEDGSTMLMEGTDGATTEFITLEHVSTGIRASFRDEDLFVTVTPAYAVTAGTVYYAAAYLTPDWSTLMLKVYDSTGEVFSTSSPTNAHTGDWTPTAFSSAVSWAGGVEMVHASTGGHATAVWETAALIASEWTLGTRTAAGGEVYTLDSPLTVAVGDTVSFSVHSGVGVLGNIAWARLVDTSTGLVVHGFRDAPSIRDGVPYFDMRVTTAGTVEVQFLVYDDDVFVNTHYLLEKNTTGGYFDGGLVRGGWLIDSTSISDYRWEGGAANAHQARSLYSEDYERTRQIVGTLYDGVLPVNVAPAYAISYNNVS